MTLEELIEKIKYDLERDEYTDFHWREDITTLINYIEDESIPKEKVRKMIEDCRERRNQLADGHFWENSWNVNEDTALVIAETALEELLKE